MSPKLVLNKLVEIHGPIQRIAVLRALQLGDLLVAVPALRLLRNCFPQAEITLISLPWARTFSQHFHHYIDRFVAFAGYPGIKEVSVETERSQHFIEEQRAYHYDLVLQMHGSGQASNPCALAFNARMTAGYYTGTRPEGLTFALPYLLIQHEILRNLELVASLMQPDKDILTSIVPPPDGTHASHWSADALRLEFPLLADDYAEAIALQQNVLSVHRPRIALHPGSRSPARRWPIAYFAQLADDLVHRFHAQVIITGSLDEQETASAVLEQMQTEAINLVGKTSLGGLAALIGQMDLFISNDTGPAHLACAVDSPSIIIFGPADPRCWAPLDQQRHVAIRHSVACSPCSYWDCPIDHRCLRGLSPEVVMRIAQKFLSHALHQV